MENIYIKLYIDLYIIYILLDSSKNYKLMWFTVLQI